MLTYFVRGHIFMLHKPETVSIYSEGNLAQNMENNLMHRQHKLSSHAQQDQVRSRPTPITVFRKTTPLENRYWTYVNGVPLALNETLALQDAAAGRIRIKTLDR
jgi:hypothetical protein